MHKGKHWEGESLPDDSDGRPTKESVPILSIVVLRLPSPHLQVTAFFVLLSLLCLPRRGWTSALAANASIDALHGLGHNNVSKVWKYGNEAMNP